VILTEMVKQMLKDDAAVPADQTHAASSGQKRCGAPEVPSIAEL
jgi:hypothetical protein